MEIRESQIITEARNAVNESIKTAKDHIRKKMEDGDNWLDSYFNVLGAISGDLQLIQAIRKTSEYDEMIEEINEVAKQARAAKNQLTADNQPSEFSDEVKEKMIEYLHKFRI